MPPPAFPMGAPDTWRSAQVYGINTGRTLRSLIPPLSSDLTIVNRPPVALSAAWWTRQSHMIGTASPSTA